MDFSLLSFEHSINLYAPGSDLRIQMQTDPRYQPFVARARRHSVLGYEMPVAAVEDVLRGKLWAHADETRRPSKRQKPPEKPDAEYAWETAHAPGHSRRGFENTRTDDDADNDADAVEEREFAFWLHPTSS